MVVGALVAACSGHSGSSSSSAIRLGLLVDLSGPFKSFGTDVLTAVNLAAGQINDAGGVNGSKVHIDVYDTTGSPQRAVVGFRELATQDDDRAVIGPVSSGEAEVVFAQASKLHLPVITGTANEEGITDLGRGWAFRNTATNSQLYATVMPIYQQRFHVSTVGLIYDEKLPVAATAAHSAIPAESQRLGIHIESTYTIQTGQSDFASVVSQLKGQDLDGLFIITGPVEGGLIAKELERQGISLPVLGHTAQNSGAFRDAGGASIESWVLPSVVDPSSTNPLFQAFQSDMARLDSDPPTVPEAANCYDIVHMVAQVMTAAKVKTETAVTEAANQIRQGLANLNGFNGIVGSVSFLPNGDVDRQVYAVLIDGDRSEAIG
jgi:branched-chain amino acid transport system substrate-binding protein